MPSSRSNTYLILFALWLMVFAASSQVIIISPILPRIGEALNISETIQGTLIPAYTVMLGIFALVIGPVSDKIGRRRVLLLGTGSMAIALFLHGAANSYISLVTMRALAGAAGGMLSGAAVAYVGDYFPYERRGWANGWVMSGIAFGQVFGIPLGIQIADWINFRWPFLIFGFSMCLAFLLIWFFVPQPDVQLSKERLSIRNSLRVYGQLLSRWTTGVATLVFFLMFLGIGIYVVYLPTWMEQMLGFTSTDIATMFFVGGVVNVITGPIAGQVSDTVGRKPLIVSSCIGLAIVMLLTTYVIANVWVAYLLFGLAMMMIAMRISPLQSLLTALVPDQRRGMLMSLSIAIGQVGIGLGGAFAGLIYTSYGFLNNTIIAAVSLVLMALLVYYGMPEPKRQPQPAS